MAVPAVGDFPRVFRMEGEWLLLLRRLLVFHGLFPQAPVLSLQGSWRVKPGSHPAWWSRPTCVLVSQDDVTLS